jgi:SAM-dependent methyltransferase
MWGLEMRKDYILSRDSPSDESAFIEEYWTAVWDSIGGQALRRRTIETTEEFKLMAPYLAALPAGSLLLDGGCGLGDFVLCYHHLGFKSVGLDISRKTIQYLKDTFPEVAFCDGDIRHTDFADNSVDVYYSWGVFEHFETGMGECLAEAHRILKPGGHLFVTVPFDNLRHALRATLEAPEPAPAESRFYQWRFTRAELARELSLNGFVVERLCPVSKREGLSRSLHHDFGFPREWRLTRVASRLLECAIPGAVIGHMIMAIAHKG